MKIIVIGYRNHAGKMLKFLSALDVITSIIVFHPDEEKIKRISLPYISEKIEFCSDISKCASSVAVFILSPNSTHIPYIKKFLKFNIYIFCEKPPAVTKDELMFLESLDEEQKDLIYFNFNFRFTTLSSKIMIFEEKYSLGKLIYANCVHSHWLAFKNGYADNWRFKSKDLLNSIWGTLTVHYVDLMNWCFNTNRIESVKFENVSKIDNCSDTVFLRLSNDENSTIDIMNSYASPFNFNMRFVFENGTVEVSEKYIKLFFPRDIIDSNGRFCRAPIVEKIAIRDTKEYFENAIKDSLYFFLDHIINSKKIERKYFDGSIATTRLILDFKK